MSKTKDSSQINQKITKVLDLLKMDQDITKECKDCEQCRLTKTLKDEIILLSAEITKLQAEQYNELTQILEKAMEKLEDKVETNIDSLPTNKILN